MVGAVRASPLPARADTEGGGGGASSGGGGSRLLTGPSAAFPRSCAVRGAGSPHRGRPRPRSPGAAANGGRPSLGAEVAASTRGASARAGKGGREGKSPPGLLEAVTGWAPRGCGGGRPRCGLPAAPRPGTRCSVGESPCVFLFRQYQKVKHFSSIQCERQGRVAAVPGGLNSERARLENPPGFPGWIRGRGKIAC